MKSNKRLFNKTVFVSNLKRFIPFSVALLVIELIVFPVVMSASFSKKEPLTMSLLMPYSIAADVIAFIFAGVMALLVFSYLFSSNKCYAMHAFPIGRNALFTTNVVSGYFLLVVPQLIGFLGALPVILLFSQDTAAILIFQLTSILLGSLVYFTIGVMAAMLAGNLFLGAVNYLILHFAYSTFVTMGRAAITTFGWGLSYDETTDLSVSVLSPLVRIIQNKSMGTPLYFMYDLSFIEAEDIAPFNATPVYTDLAIYSVCAIALLAIAWFLYKKRPLECAGDMVAFKAEIPIISVLVSICGGYYVAKMLSFFLYSDTAIIIVEMVVFVIFSCLFFFTAQMILHKSSKVFRLKQFLIWGSMCIVCLSSVWAVSGFLSNYIPPFERIENVTIDCTYRMQLTETEDVANAQELHQLLIDEEIRENDDIPQENEILYDSFAPVPYDFGCYGVDIIYTLKNGKSIVRNYDIPEHSSEPIAAMNALEQLELSHPPQTVFDMLEGYNIKVVSCEIFDVNSDEDSVFLKSEELEPFYQLCADDAHQLVQGYTSLNLGDIENNSQYYVSFEFTIADKVQAEELTRQYENNDFCFYDPIGNSVDIPSYMTNNRFCINVYAVASGGNAEAFLKQRLAKG